MLTLQQKVRPHPEVVDTTLDDEMVLLHLESKTYFSLNITGLRIWKGLQQGLDLAAISQRLQTEFDVDREQADRSVLALIEDLLQQQLVLFEDD